MMATFDGTPTYDALVGTIEADVIRSLEGRDSISGLTGNDGLDGNDGDDPLIGGAGSDWLRGGIDGADLMEGGTDKDRYNVDSLGDSVIELENEGVDTVKVDGDGTAEFFIRLDGVHHLTAVDFVL